MIPTYIGYLEQSSSFIHVVVYINIPSILRLSDIPLYAYTLVCFVCINVSIYINVSINRGFPDGSAVKNPSANAGDLVSIPGLGRSHGEGNANISSVLAWKIPRREETGGLQTGCKRVRHNLATKHLSMDTWGAATFSVLLDEYQKQNSWSIC